MKKILVRFYQFLWKYKWQMVVFLLVKVVAAILVSLHPYFLKKLIDEAESGQAERLVKILLFYVGVRLVGGWITTLAHYLGDRVVVPAARDVRIKVFSYIQELDFAFHVDKNTGSLISAFKRGDGAFFNMYFHIFHDILGILVSLLVSLYFFAGISIEILGLMAGLFVVNVVISLFLVKINLKKRKEFNKAEDRVSGIITDNLLNYETVKFFAQEKREEKRLRENFVDWYKKIWDFTNSFRLMGITLNTTSSLGFFLMLWLVVKKLMIGEIGMGDFVMVAGFLSAFYYRFFELFFQLRNLAKNFMDVDKYFGVLDNAIAVKDPRLPKQIDKVQGKIEFKEAEFSYPRRKKKVLKDINLRIKAGESVAFVGRSGAGKTTIVKMLLRFYNLKSGKILIDGLDIKQMKKSYLRSLMGVVPQEPILFNNTIAFNIGYGIDGASKKMIKEAAKEANLDEFIEELPEKYETEVGERGIKLSGGQKQRLAIARAFLTNPSIVIFDEATSNLDSESEEKIQDALWGVAEDRTVLIIAHRFATIRRADRIVVMDKGRIVETGIHQDLVSKKGGVYRKLWRLQVKGKLEKDEGGLLTKG